MAFVSIRPFVWMAAASLTLCILTACGPKEDPGKAAFLAYKSQVEVPLQQEEALSKLFVAIIQDKNEVDQSVARLKAEGIPLAQTYLDAVKAIQPAETNLKDLHDRLIKSAQGQLEGYQAVVQGYEAKDMNLFNSGREKITQSKIEEETYIADLDKAASGYATTVTYFASGAAPAPQ